MPKTPSNRATANVMPGCFTASPNCWRGTGRPATCGQRNRKQRETSILMENTKSYNEIIGMVWPAKLRNAVKQKGHVSEHMSNSQRPCPRWWSQTSCLCRTGWKTLCRSERMWSTSLSCNDGEALMREESKQQWAGPKMFVLINQ